MGIGDPQTGGHIVGTITHGNGATHSRTGTARTTDFNAVSTRQQGVGRGQQGIRPCGQARYALSDMNLASHHRIACTIVGRQWRHHLLYTWHDGIDRVARKLGQHEAVIGALNQGVQTGIRRTTPPRQETCSCQFPTTRQIQQGTFLHVHAGGFQAEITQQTAQAHIRRIATCIVIGQPIHRPAVGHDQTRGTDRGNTARTHHHGGWGLRGTTYTHAQFQLPQGSQQHTALINIARHQAQDTQGRIRLGDRATANALDTQAALRVILCQRVIPLIALDITAGNHLRRHTSSRIDAASRQHQIPFGQQLCTITDRMLQETKVVLRAQIHRIKTGTRYLGLATLQGPAQRTEGDLVGYVQHIGIDTQIGVWQQLGQSAFITVQSLNQRSHILVAGGMRCPCQTDMRRGQLDRSTGHRARGQGNLGGGQMETLAQLQIHTIFNRQNAVGQQGQIIKAPRLNAVHTHTSMAVDQTRISTTSLQIKRQILQLLLLHQGHFAVCQHAITRPT